MSDRQPTDQEALSNYLQKRMDEVTALWAGYKRRESMTPVLPNETTEVLRMHSDLLWGWFDEPDGTRSEAVNSGIDLGQKVNVFREQAARFAAELEECWRYIDVLRRREPKA